MNLVEQILLYKGSIKIKYPQLLNIIFYVSEYIYITFMKYKKYNIIK